MVVCILQPGVVVRTPRCQIVETCPLRFFVDDEVVGQAVFFGLGLAAGFFPAGFVQGREIGVAFNVGVDFGGIYLVTLVQAQAEDLFATDDEDVLCVVCGRSGDGCFKGGDAFGAGGLVTGIAGNNDVASARQGATQGFPGFTAHDNGTAQGGFFEVGQVARDVPWHGVFFADDEVVSVGNDDVQGCHMLGIWYLLGTWFSAN